MNKGLAALVAFVCEVFKTNNVGIVAVLDYLHCVRGTTTFTTVTRTIFETEWISRAEMKCGIHAKVLTCTARLFVYSRKSVQPVLHVEQHVWKTAVGLDLKKSFALDETVGFHLLPVLCTLFI